MYYVDPNKTYGEKTWRQLHKNAEYWTSPGDSTPQNNNCTATYHPSRKLSKLDEPNTRGTAREVGTSM